MDEPAYGAVPEILEQNGLVGAAFDVAAIADGLDAWRQAGGDLDRLLEGSTAMDPSFFDPEWR